MEKIRETYKNPEEYLPQTFGATIHYITQEDGVDVYEFDFLDSEGKSVWNYISKHKDYHDLMRTVIEIKTSVKMRLLFCISPTTNNPSKSTV